MKTSTNLTITKLLTTAAKRRASDVHLSVGSYPLFRIDNTLIAIEDESVVTSQFLEDFLSVVLNERQQNILEKKKSVRARYQLEDKLRFRITVHYQRGVLGVSLKLIRIQVPTLQDLSLYEGYKKFVSLTDGLVVVSGPYNSGKTTVVAALIEQINTTRSENIVTLEDPIEYIFVNHKSIIQQRQIGRDVNSLSDGIRQCKDEDVDIVVIGENQEPEVISAVFELAESGKLVFYSSEAMSVVQSLERLLRAFKVSEAQKAQRILSGIFKAGVSLRLIPKTSAGVVLAHEMLFSNHSVASLIAEGKFQQLVSVMQTSPEEGMITLDQYLSRLVEQEMILPEAALREAIDKEHFLHTLKKT